METLDLLALIRNTYGLALVLKDNITGLKLESKVQTRLTALTDTLEQNLYNINVGMEELIDLH